MKAALTALAFWILGVVTLLSVAYLARYDFRVTNNGAVVTLDRWSGTEEVCEVQVGLSRCLFLDRSQMVVFHKAVPAPAASQTTTDDPAFDKALDDAALTLAAHQPASAFGWLDGRMGNAILGAVAGLLIALVTLGWKRIWRGRKPRPVADPRA